MPGKLLILTYHLDGATTGEDLRFKHEAITRKLLTGDAMDDTGQNNNGPKPYLDLHARELFHDPKLKGPSGLDIATLDQTTTSLVTINGLGTHTWRRAAYAIKEKPGGPRERTIFEAWLDKVFAVSAEVLVLAGHHSGGQVWGSQLQDTSPFYMQSSLYPSVNGTTATHMYSYDAKPVKGYTVRAGPFDLSPALKTCRLVVVFACNGATPYITPWRELIKRARGGRAPFMFGFYGIHSMPRDKGKQFVSPELWKNLEALAPGNPGNKNLEFLDVDEEKDPELAEKIRNCWFNALNKAFPQKSVRRHLFFSNKSSKDRGPRGAAVISPQGRIFRVVNDAGKVEEGQKLP